MNDLFLNCNGILSQERSENMKYEKPIVKRIIFNNEDILVASPHKCPGEPGSDGCDNNGVLCMGPVQRDYGSCVLRIFRNLCSQEAGTNSIDPSESI